MSLSLRLKAVFLGRAIAVAMLVRLALAALFRLFGPMAGLAGYANELSVLIGIIMAARFARRINRYHTQRVALCLLEEGFVKWAAQVDTRKSVTSPPSLKKTG